MSKSFSFVLPGVCIVLALLDSTVLAQQPQPKQAGRVRISGQQQQRKAEPRQQQIPPELQKILIEWYNNTRTIERLEGSTKKFEYDATFLVEKRGTGQFYYEKPDKGRIDVDPAELKPGEKSQKVDPKMNQRYKLTTASQEKWISTGKEIIKIEPVQKKAERFPIPPKAQGRNIMDGPLPFLLGMPPNKAVQRYWLRIIKDENGKPKNNANQVWLQVWPKWKADAAIYREAKVILNKKNHYLPSAVELTDPTGHQTTVYVFDGLEVNKRAILPEFFGKDPFKINLAGFRVQNAPPPKERKPAPPPGNLQTVPNLSGHQFEDAKKFLEQLGFKVKFLKGSIARNEKDVYHVEAQNPAPYRKVKKGSEVVVKLYVKREDLGNSNGNSKERTAAKP